MADGNVSNNDGAVSKGPSALALLLKSIEGKKVNDSDKKKTVEAFKKAMGKRQELENQLKSFDEETDALAVNMIKCFGGKQVEVNGQRFAPTSRGSRVYYKKLADSNEVEKL